MSLIQRGAAVVIWGLDSQPPVSEKNIVLWNRYLPSKNWAISPKSRFIAINDLVEVRAISYRSRLLTYLLELRSLSLKQNDLKINRVPIWDLLSFSEKSNYAESGLLNDLIKILALKDFLIENKVQVSNVNLKDKEISKVIKNICYDGQKTERLARSSYQSITTDTLRNLKAIIYLLYSILYSFSFSKRNIELSKTAKYRVIFQLYKFLKNNQNNQDSIKNHWGGLRHSIVNSKQDVVWLCLDIFGNKLTDFLRNVLNRPEGLSQGSNELYVRVRSQLRFSAVLHVIIDYFKAVSSRRQLTAQLPRLENIEVSHFIASSIRNDCIGPRLMDRIILSYCFNELKFIFQNSAACYYLAENYFWEKILIECFRSYSNGILGGVLHSTVRFWDLRYHNADAFEIADVKVDRFYPDKFIINGPLARTCLIESGYPLEFLQTIGSLRYSAPDCSFRNQESQRCFDLLVVGDYTEESFAKQIQVCNELAGQENLNLRIGLKIHPGFVVEGYNLASEIKLIEGLSFPQALGMSSVVLCGQVTSSSLEALYWGKKVLVLLDGDLLNLSPVRGLEGVEWVENAKQVLRVLREHDGASYHPHAFEFEDFLVGNGVDNWCEELTQLNSKNGD